MPAAHFLCFHILCTLCLKSPTSPSTASLWDSFSLRTWHRWDSKGKKKTRCSPQLWTQWQSVSSEKKVTENKLLKAPIEMKRRRNSDFDLPTAVVNYSLATQVCPQLTTNFLSLPTNTVWCHKRLREESSLKLTQERLAMFLWVRTKWTWDTQFSLIEDKKTPIHIHVLSRNQSVDSIFDLKLKVIMNHNRFVADKFSVQGPLAYHITKIFPLWVS